MGSPHRKMLEEICTFYCNMKDPSSCSSSSSDCKHCKIICSYADPPVLSIPSSPSLEDYVDPTDPSSSHHTIIATWLTIIISFLSAAFFFLLCFALYRRFLFKRRRRNISSLEEGQDGNTQRGDFIDEEHGPMVDHPIWYIRTPGLNQSVISAITVCTYKKGEGLIDGTECSVCLSEFEDDESLRLLPKCNHAFHLTCIDTWLRSHTNCPLCRAPIVANPAAVLDSSERNFVGLDHSEEPQMERVEIGGENDGGVIESSDGELRNRESEEERGIVNEEGEEEVGNLQARRRSVSLDSSAVEKINRILARSVVGSSSSSKRVAKSGSSSFRMKSLQIVAGASMKRSRSHSWYGRSQRKPSAPIRSF